MADPGQVENALLNLAINASHAMPDGGNPSILTETAPSTSEGLAQHWAGQPGDYVALRAIDNGTGIPKDVLEHVFEPFFSTKEVGQGTGLGLSMVYGFSRQSGGDVRIESTPGEGTVIKLYLPRANSVAPRREREKSERAYAQQDMIA